MKREEQQRWLLVALLVLALVVSWRWVGPLFGGRDDAWARQQWNRVSADQVVELNLASLDAPARDYTPGRNIFHFGRKPAPPPPPPPPPAPPPPPGVPPPPRKVEPRAPTPPKFAVPLMGIFGPERRRIAVFKDGEEIVNALEEDVIKEKFIVHQINFETVDIAFVGFPDAKPQRVKIGN